MFDGRGISTDLAGGADEHPREVPADAQWRDTHEVRSLLDMLSIYRRCAADLAAENLMLREEVAMLAGSTCSGSPGSVLGRCRRPAATPSIQACLR